MATVTVTPDIVSVSLTTGERVTGLLRDLQLPRSAVVSAEVVTDGLTGTRGLRAPGLSLPWTRKIGTWRRPGERVFVSVRAGEPALRLRVSHPRWSEVLVGTPDAALLAAELSQPAAQH
jgi:hypothetical protein